jgi:1-acyl-sn-glycerol-3-phosphate acyltransferase
MHITGQIKVQRGDKEQQGVHDAVHDHLEEGKLIGIFPEGTRSPHKNKMLRPFTSVARYAIYKKVPVIPVGLIGTFDVMSRQDKKPQFRKLISIHVGTPINLSHHDHSKVTREEYRHITNSIMQKIAELSGKEAYVGM